MDRSFRGGIAGIIGGIVMNVWSFLVYLVLNIKIVRFLDWAGFVLYGHLPRNTFEALYALIIQIIFAGFLGVVLAFVVKQSTSRGYILKGIFFGLITGFFIYAVPVFLNTPILSDLPLNNVISNHFGGILWGATTAYMLQKLDQSPIVTNTPK